MRKKAIIFLVNSLSNGGAERVVANMANGYNQADYETIVICIHQRPSSYQLNSDIQKFVILSGDSISRTKKILAIPVITHRLNKIIKQQKMSYDVKLITSHLIFSNFIAKLSRYRKEIIDVVHVSYKASFSRMCAIFPLFLKWLYSGVPVVTVSKGCEKEITDLYRARTSHISTIHNPIDIEMIQAKSFEEAHNEKKRPYLLFVGRLDKEKRPELLIDVFYKGGFYKHCNLVIVGAGPLEHIIKSKIRQYNISDSVDVRGWESNVFPFMKEAELLINCSSFEAFPMSFIEAFACDCPVVSFGVDYGPNEILTGDLAKFLAKDGDVDDMILKIKMALKEYPADLPLKVQPLDVTKINSQYLKTYKEWGLGD